MTDEAAVEAMARAACVAKREGPDDLVAAAVEVGGENTLFCRAWENEAVGIRAALTAYHAHLEAEGRVIVPVEPTEAMVEAASQIAEGHMPCRCPPCRENRRRQNCERWTAMLTASKGE